MEPAMLIFTGIPLAIAFRIFAWRWFSRKLAASELLRMIWLAASCTMGLLMLVAWWMEYSLR
jgi:hypothetical protein